MTGIVAVSTNRVDSGVIQDTKLCFYHSKERGGLGENIVILPLISGEVVVVDKSSALPLAMTKASLDEERLVVLGCTKSSAELEFSMSNDGRWYVAIDGAVSRLSLAEVAESIARLGFVDACLSFEGQFAIVAAKQHDSRLYWATKAKPLYALFGDVRGSVRIVSQRKYLDGMYHPTRTTSPVSLGPYAIGSIDTQGIITGSAKYPLKTGRGTVILSGGGLDTAVTTYAASRTYGGEPISLLFFDYGQRSAEQEWQATVAMAASVNGTSRRMSLHELGYLLNSPLTGQGSVSHLPVRGYASEWVPGRNTLFAGFGISFAEAQGFARVGFGINAEAAVAYPDNEMEWLNRVKHLSVYALGVGRSLEFYAPLAGMSKLEIVRFGNKLKLPWRVMPSWSCYEGGELHCGTCSSCRARREAFRATRTQDPTEYAA